MKLERSTPEDAAEYAKWMWDNRAENLAQIESLKDAVVYKIDGILHLPVKAVVMTGSLAPNPEVTGAKRLLALRRAFTDLRTMYPHTEIVFLTKGDSTLDEAARYFGFEELPFKLYRMRPDARSTAAKKYREQVATEVVVQHDP